MIRSSEQKEILFSVERFNTTIDKAILRVLGKHKLVLRLVKKLLRDSFWKPQSIRHHGIIHSENSGMLFHLLYVLFVTVVE